MHTISFNFIHFASRNHHFEHQMSPLSAYPPFFARVQGRVITQIVPHKGHSIVWAGLIAFGGDPLGSARSARFGGDVGFEIECRLHWGQEAPLRHG